MKLTRFFLVVAAIAAVSISSCNKFKGSSRLKNDVDSASYYLGMYYGMNIKQMDMPNFNYEVFNKAVQEVINKKDSKINMQEAGMFLNNYFSKLQIKQGEKNLKDGQEFLAKNKTRGGVTTTASGLQFEIIKEGTGPKPKADDMVSVQYKGNLIDGTEFESSYDNGKPISFEVGKVIRGWSEVLQLMKVGSKYKVFIPTELAYGANPQRGGKIKPNMALIFEIELLSIEPKKPEQPIPAGQVKPKLNPMRK